MRYDSRGKRNKERWSKKYKKLAKIYQEVKRKILIRER